MFCAGQSSVETASLGSGPAAARLFLVPHDLSPLWRPENLPSVLSPEVRLAVHLGCRDSGTGLAGLLPAPCPAGPGAESRKGGGEAELAVHTPERLKGRAPPAPHCRPWTACRHPVPSQRCCWPARCPASRSSGLRPLSPLSSPPSQDSLTGSHHCVGFGREAPSPRLCLVFLRCGELPWQLLCLVFLLAPSPASSLQERVPDSSCREGGVAGGSVFLEPSVGGGRPQAPGRGGWGPMLAPPPVGGVRTEQTWEGPLGKAAGGWGCQRQW